MKVLNDRMRFDAGTLMPELASNGIYRNQEDKCYQLPNGYVKNMIMYQEAVVWYSQPVWGFWCWYGDEIIAMGQYDFALKLPPVPEGTYEIRYGYVPMTQRGVAQVYVDNIPCGIPIDLKMNASGTPNPKIGWFSEDGLSAEEIVKKALEEKVDLIGLSGLITPSLDEMVHVAMELHRVGLQIPIMIGGATTSALHTALKIAPVYDGPVVHLKDASQNVLVAARLMNPEQKEAYVEALKQEQAELRERNASKQARLVSMEEALKNKLKLFD
jgi:hypothetical protein